MHVTIQSTEESKVRRQRRDICIHGVVHLHGDKIIRADIEARSNIINKCREPALMLADKAAVDINIGNGRCAVKFQKKVAVGTTAIHCTMNPIPADAAVVILAAILAVKIVPSVRQVYYCQGGSAKVTAFL